MVLDFEIVELVSLLKLNAGKLETEDKNSSLNNVAYLPGKCVIARIIISERLMGCWKQRQKRKADRCAKQRKDQQNFQPFSNTRRISPRDQVQ